MGQAEGGQHRGDLPLPAQRGVPQPEPGLRFVALQPQIMILIALGSGKGGGQYLGMPGVGGPCPYQGPNSFSSWDS